jgi:hypothetical protein
VQSALSLGVDGANPTSVDLGLLTLAVDVAVDPDAQLVAVVAPGNWGGGPGQLQLYSLKDLANAVVVNPPPPQQSSASGAAGVGAGEPPLPNAGSAALARETNCFFPASDFAQPDGQATALAFVAPDVLAVQTREPAAISFLNVRTHEASAPLDLKQPSRFDTGHAMFHFRAGAGVACASCHAEVGDDAHVWTFHGIGARRTQNLRGGILGSEPFHWNGDMKDFPTLVNEVFVGRMAGFSPSQDQTDALSHWIDRQPELQATSSDEAAARRGQTLFESEAVGCASCHNGRLFTNNQLADVGTGAMLQVPALRGVSFRAPLMHDGCAATLADRFGPCGGGDKHGHTSQLSSAQLSDLTRYLETL